MVDLPMHLRLTKNIVRCVTDAVLKASPEDLRKAADLVQLSQDQAKEHLGNMDGVISFPFMSAYITFLHAVASERDELNRSILEREGSPNG